MSEHENDNPLFAMWYILHIVMLVVSFFKVIGVIEYSWLIILCPLLLDLSFLITFMIFAITSIILSELFNRPR